MKMDFHIHSKFSDGLNAPEEIVEQALSLGFSAICITDHVRKNTKWVPEFSRHISSLKERYSGKINIYSALEARVINGKGNIDFLPEWSGLIDFIYAAFHEIPHDDGYMSAQELVNFPDKVVDFWSKALLKVLKNPLVDVIAHPGALLREYQIHIPHQNMQSIALEANRNGKIFEINARHKVPEQDFLEILKLQGTKLIYGSDSHSLTEFISYSDLAESICEEAVNMDNIVATKIINKRAR